MADSLTSAGNGDQNQDLERRVDDMMDSTRKDASHGGPAVQPESASGQPIDIFVATKTAPEISGETYDGPQPQSESSPSPSQSDMAQASGVDVAGTPPKESDDAAASEAELTSFDDSTTDAAIDAITAQDGDAVLAAEDTAKQNEGLAPASHGHWLSSLLHKWWFWTLIVIVVIAGILGIPASRYPVLGAFMERPFTLTVIDSTTNTPVSGAKVSLGKVVRQTDNRGSVTLEGPVGHRDLTVQKQYYKQYSTDVLVPVSQEGTTKIRLVATGRQVPVHVTDRLTGQPVANAEIRVLDTGARTDGNGTAIVVLPTVRAKQSARITAPGYNTATVTVEVTDRDVAANHLALTPAGTVYFLSNQSGKIDVVRSNLDGSSRQVVLTGTGNEDTAHTVLLSSRDWRYVALLSKRDTTKYPKLYVFDTANNDKLITIDQTAGTFTLVGWYGHYFVYYVSRPDAPAWQNYQSSLMSYNADTGKMVTLDQTQAQGDSSRYAYQTFYNFTIMSNKILYGVAWNDSTYETPSALLAGKTNALRGVQPDGQNKKDYKTFDSQTSGYMQTKSVRPASLYVAVYLPSQNSYAYYQFDGTNVTQSNGISQQNFDKLYPTYLLSPSGSKTVWSELRDGKNVTFTGDGNGGNPKQITTNGDYRAYGWYGEQYILVSKDASELYVLPAAGLPASSSPLKIADYYKPGQDFGGYGYGYGGL